MPGPITAFNELDPYKQIQWLSPKSRQPDPFNVLILGDGFLGTERPLFESFLQALRDSFFRIPPFGFCRPYINLLYCFTPSANSGLPVQDVQPADEWFTVYRLYRSNTRIRTWDQQRVLQVVHRLQLPAEFEVPFWLNQTPDDIWLNSVSKSYGAIIVVANTIAIDPSIKLSGINFNQIERPPEIEAGLASTFRWAAVPMNNYQPPPYGLNNGYVHIFAHELAHSLGLGDEYELEGAEYLQPVGLELGESDQVADRYSNVAYIESVDSASIAGNIKWGSLLTTEEREAYENSSRVFTKERLVELGHLSNANDSDREISDFIPGTNQRVHWTQIHLVEGATYRRKWFRSNCECKMRFDTYDERVTNNPYVYAVSDSGQLLYGAPEFCRVCNYGIRMRITGFDKSNLESIKRDRLETLFYQEVMPRVSKSFQLQNAQSRRDHPEDPTKWTNYSVAGPFCEHASIRAYIVFRTLSPPVSVDLTMTSGHVSLIYQGIYLDPTFYDMYRLDPSSNPNSDEEMPLPGDCFSSPDGESDLLYVTPSGASIAFSKHRVCSGFAGTIHEIESLVSRYRMRYMSYGNKIPPPYDPPNAYYPSREIVDVIYLSRPQIWKGPVEPDPVHPDDLQYVLTMRTVWREWRKYAEEEDPDKKAYKYFAPLDTSLSLAFVLGL